MWSRKLDNEEALAPLEGWGLGGAVAQKQTNVRNNTSGSLALFANASNVMSDKHYSYTGRGIQSITRQVFLTMLIRG